MNESKFNPKCNKSSSKQICLNSIAIKPIFISTLWFLQKSQHSQIFFNFPVQKIKVTYPNYPWTKSDPCSAFTWFPGPSTGWRHNSKLSLYSFYAYKFHAGSELLCRLLSAVKRRGFAQWMNHPYAPPWTSAASWQTSCSRHHYSLKPSRRKTTEGPRSVASVEPDHLIWWDFWIVERSHVAVACLWVCWVSLFASKLSEWPLPIKFRKII